VRILVAFYYTHELRWGYSLLPATTREHGRVLSENRSIFHLFPDSM